MLDRLKSMAHTAKENVKNNKAAYAFGALAISAIALQQRNRKNFDAFLVEKNIDLDEYYCPEEFEEKQEA